LTERRVGALGKAIRQGRQRMSLAYDLDGQTAASFNSHPHRCLALVTDSGIDRRSNKYAQWRRKLGYKRQGNCREVSV